MQQIHLSIYLIVVTLLWCTLKPIKILVFYNTLGRPYRVIRYMISWFKKIKKKSSSVC